MGAMVASTFTNESSKPYEGDTLSLPSILFHAPLIKRRGGLRGPNLPTQVSALRRDILGTNSVRYPRHGMEPYRQIKVDSALDPPFST
jgi:hypothetical protein